MKKKDLENFEFIKNKFDKAVPDVPLKLDEQIIERKIIAKAEHKTVKIKTSNRIKFKAVLSAAACLLLFFSLIFSVYQRYENPPASPVQIQTFKNYDELNEMIDNLDNRYAEAKEGLDGYQGGQMGGGSDDSFINNGCDGVTDADTILTDGNYIYYSYNNSEWANDFITLRIYRVNGSETQLVSEINTDAASSNMFIRDMFLYKNRLVLNINRYDKTASGSAITRIYDVSNPEKPKLLSEFSQTGRYISAKMIGNIAYIVSNYSVSENPKANRVPEISSGYEKAEVKVENIACFDDSVNSQYSVISPINIETGERAGEAKAVLGASKYVYCTKDSIYLLKYSVEFGQAYVAEVSNLNTDELGIIKADINNGEIVFSAKGTVSGYIDNVDVMNENNGFFTIITTKLDKKDRPVANTLYVLNKDLNVVAETDEFAAGKRVQTALFKDDKVYVSLFHNEDPVIAVIDFGDKKSPVVKNEFNSGGVIEKITAVNDNQVLCVGNIVEPAGENGSYQHGLMLTLLDISSDSVKITDSFKSEEYSAYVKDLFADYDSNSYLTSVEFFNENGNSDGFSGVLRFNIIDNRFEINKDTDEFYNEYVENYHQNGYIAVNDYIYSFTISGFDESDDVVITVHKFR